MELIVIIIVLLGIVVAIRVGRTYLHTGGDEARSVDRYGQALRTLRTLPERATTDDLDGDTPAGSGPVHLAGGNAAMAPDRRREIPVSPLATGGPGPGTTGVRGTVARGTAAPVQPPTARGAGPLRPPTLTDEPIHRGLAALSFETGPRPAKEAARIIGLDERPGDRDPAVEANARLTGTTGLVLIVLLFVEGLTIPFIGRLVSWHILIGLILIPPLLVKMASVSWRFSRYYLHDPRYRRSGPPHPLLRILGPLVMGSTILLFASGIDLWLTGPTDRTMFRIHQLTFVFWFIVVAIHVASHLLRATRLAAADAAAANGGRGVDVKQRRKARTRRTLIGASLVVGLVVGFAGRTVSTAWTDGHIGQPTVSRTNPGTSSPPSTSSTAAPTPGNSNGSTGTSNGSAGTSNGSAGTSNG